MTMPFYRKIELFFNRRGFYAVLVLSIIAIKIVCMGLFSSDYQTKMFEPFVADFIDGFSTGRLNPYQNFFDNSRTIDFPYPSVMLLIMSLGAGLNAILPDMGIFLHNVIFKLPLFVMDCVVFYKLCKIYPDRRVNVTMVYFASPIVLYATYMHGQLDIVPMTFLFFALLYLTGTGTEKHLMLSALFFSCALLSKLHIIAVLPLVFLYIYKHRGMTKATTYATCVGLMTIGGIVPFFGDGFIRGVLFNDAQSALFSFSLSYGNISIYLSLVVLLFVYLYIANFNFIDAGLLFGLSGLIFAVFLIFCAPMPGWYMWIMIFLTYFLVRSSGYKHCVFCFALLEVFYILFFVFFHISRDNVCDLYFLGTSCDFLKVDIDFLRNISFSIMTGAMTYVVVLMHKYCVAGNSVYSFHDSSFVIGICGDSGAGKSMLQNSLASMFSSHNFLRIEGDGDHKWERGDRNWDNFTHLNPQANYLYRQAMDVKRLKNGESVRRVEYDHKTGHFSSEMTVRPCRFISVSGLHILYLPQLRNIVDLKIYVEADEDVRIRWKMDRDSKSRGHTKEEILEQIESRRDDAVKFVYPQRNFADIIISYSFDPIIENDIAMTIHISTKIDMDNIVTILQQFGLTLTYTFSEDFKYQIIEYRPSDNRDVDKIDFERIFVNLFSNGYDLLSESFSAVDTLDGIKKLVLVRAIYAKLRGEI